MLDLSKTVTVGQLIEWAGQFNEDGPAADNSEYFRGQVELICDAAGVPIEENRAAVSAAVVEAANKFYGRKG